MDRRDGRLDHRRWQKSALIEAGRPRQGDDKSLEPRGRGDLVSTTALLRGG
jgi:hypothetical protein